MHEVRKARVSADIREDVKKEAMVKAYREDIALQQVVERLLAGWAVGDIELPEPVEGKYAPADPTVAEAFFAT